MTSQSLSISLSLVHDRGAATATAATGPSLQFVLGCSDQYERPNNVGWFFHLPVPLGVRHGYCSAGVFFLFLYMLPDHNGGPCCCCGADCRNVAIEQFYSPGDTERFLIVAFLLSADDERNDYNEKDKYSNGSFTSTESPQRRATMALYVPWTLAMTRTTLNGRIAVDVRNKDSW